MLQEYRNIYYFITVLIVQDYNNLLKTHLLAPFKYL
jgi:hypothetical protein